MLKFKWDLLSSDAKMYFWFRPNFTITAIEAKKPKILAIFTDSLYHMLRNITEIFAYLFIKSEFIFFCNDWQFQIQQSSEYASKT